MHIFKVNVEFKWIGLVINKNLVLENVQVHVNHEVT